MPGVGQWNGTSWARLGGEFSLQICEIRPSEFDDAQNRYPSRRQWLEAAQAAPPLADRPKPIRRDYQADQRR